MIILIYCNTGCDAYERFWFMFDVVNKKADACLDNHMFPSIDHVSWNVINVILWTWSHMISKTLHLTSGLWHGGIVKSSVRKGLKHVIDYVAIFVNSVNGFILDYFWITVFELWVIRQYFILFNVFNITMNVSTCVTPAWRWQYIPYMFIDNKNARVKPPTPNCCVGILSIKTNVTRTNRQLIKQESPRTTTNGAFLATW